MLQLTTALKAAGVVVGALSLGVAGVAQADPGGGGNGGGKPEVPPGQVKDKGKPDNPGKGSGDLYGDLVVLYRDVAITGSGLPILDDNACLQPITHTDIGHLAATQVTDLYGQPAWLIPLIGDAGDEETACDLVGSDTEDPADDVAIYLEEVDFGRLNMGRSPEKVLARLLDDATATLTGQVIGLDPAGRLTYADGSLTIDAPGANLAMHQQFQEIGVLYDANGSPIALPGSMSFLDHAGAMLGAAADKTGQVDVDLLVYNNRVLDTPDETIALGKIEGGTVAGFPELGVPGEMYVDYSTYTYDRAAMYDGCAAGSLIERVDTDGDGVLEPQLVSIAGEAVMDIVFGGDGLTESGVLGFAARADDARAVIEYIHSNTLADLDPLGSTSCPAPAQ